jgi:hypothetical protein
MSLLTLASLSQNMCRFSTKKSCLQTPCSGHFALLLLLQAQLVSGLQEIPVTFRPASGGSFQGSYTPPPSAAGSWVLEVLLNGKHARGSPFAVQIHKQLVVARSEDEFAAAASALGVQETTSSSGCGETVKDMVSWWGKVAATEYAAVDGNLIGFDEPKLSPDDAVGPEQKYVQVRKEGVHDSAYTGVFCCITV